MTVGEYIKILRTNKNITQEELGKMIGVQRAAVQKWESGITQNLKRTTIKKLATFFDVPASSFIIENESTASNNESGLDAELIKLFSKLTPEEQTLILAQIKGILSSRE